MVQHWNLITATKQHRPIQVPVHRIPSNDPKRQNKKYRFYRVSATISKSNVSLSILMICMSHKQTFVWKSNWATYAMAWKFWKSFSLAFVRPNTKNCTTISAFLIKRAFFCHSKWVWKRRVLERLGQMIKPQQIN